MRLERSAWPTIAAYLFVDRKLDRSSEYQYKSRYLSLCDFLEKSNLPFSRPAFISFIEHKISEGSKPGTLNVFISLAKHLNQYSKQCYNYDAGLSDFSRFPIHQVMIEILSPEECLMIAECDYPYTYKREYKQTLFRAFFLLLTLTGLRKSEALQLKWSDVTEELIRVNDTKSGLGRIIPNNKLLNDALLDLRRLHRSTYVFPGTKTYMNHRTAHEDLRRRCEYLRFKKHAWLHLFRHSFCVEMLRHNDVTLVAKLMGHSNIASTYVYSHYLIEDMRDAILTHTLLKEKQDLTSIGKRVVDFIRRLIDGKTYRVDYSSSAYSFVIKVSRLSNNPNVITSLAK